MTYSTSITIFSAVLQVIGWTFVLRTGTAVLSNFYKYFVRSPQNLRRLGDWAVITGATDGIGKAYAFALSKRGLKVLLISRSEERLQSTAQEIQTAHSEAVVKTLAVDLGSLGHSEASAEQTGWKKLQEALQSLPCGLLINNVGLSYDHPEYFDKLRDSDADQIIQLNVVAATKITKLVLPGMKERRKGAVVFIGSAAATVLPASPLLAVYGASKAYLDQLARSLSMEYRSAGISFQNQAPLYVATKMSKIRRASLSAPSPQAWVNAAIRHIGYEVTITPYWVHGLMWWALSFLPELLISAYVLRLHQSIRKRWYAKQKQMQ